MPIVSTDIKYFLSGGAANSDVDASLGGARSSTEIVDATTHNLFDQVSADETTSGDTEYRCIYISNEHGTLTYQGAAVHIETNTPSTDTSVEIGLGTAAVDGTEQTVADESTAPAGVTFGTAAGYANRLTIGDLTAGQHKAVWIKRVVNAAAGAYNSDSVVIRATGATAA